MSQKQWLQLATLPTEHRPRHIFVMDNNDIISIDNNGDLYRYHPNENQWHLYAKGPNDFQTDTINSTINSRAYDAKLNDLYIITENNFHRFNISSHKLIPKPLIIDNYTVNKWDGWINESIIINNDYHIIEYRHDSIGYHGDDEFFQFYKHLILNKHTNQFDIIHDFETNAPLAECGVVYVEKLQILLFLGGHSGIDEKRIFSNTIWWNSVQTGIWKKSPLLLPQRMSSFGVILTNDQKNIIMFGGIVDKQHVDTILVLNLETKTIKKSKLKCPLKTGYHAVIIANKQSETNTFVIGFCRQFNQYVVNDVVEVIKSFYVWNDVHLFKRMVRYDDPIHHWKMNIDHILNSLL